MDILITGVAGMIGSKMAQYILDNYPEHRVIGIDSMFGGYEENIPYGVDFYKLDLADADIKFIFEKYNIELVYHFAAYAAEGLSPFIRKFNYSNNVLSTVNIINECINFNVRRLVYTSSMSVYGHGNRSVKLITEDTPCNPIDPYGVSKYTAEMDIKIAGEQHGLDWCIIRPHNVFGENQNIWDKYRNVLGIWMNKALLDEPFLIYGDGEQMRAFSYIDNILPGLWKAGNDKQCSKQIINLGGMKAFTINDAAKIVADITGTNKIKHVEGRYEAKYSIPTYDKSVKLLGYDDTVSFEEGLKRMWEWAKKQPKRQQYKWPEYEINKGIYSYWR